jgi:hypothetical protein
MSDDMFYFDCCSLMSGYDRPSIWTFNCPCPSIASKHANHLNHICRFQERPTLSPIAPNMTDTWQEQYDHLRDTFLHYRPPARYMTTDELSLHYNIMPPTSSSHSSNTSSSSSSSSEESGILVKKEVITKKTKVVFELKSRHYTLFDDFLSFISHHEFVLRTKLCNRFPVCDNEECTFNHSIEESTSLFQLPLVIDFYANAATICDKQHRPNQFNVQKDSAFRCSACKLDNCASFQLSVILYSQSTRLLRYPIALVICRLCNKKTPVPIYK